MVRYQRFGWLGLAVVSLSQPMNAADSPRVTIPVPRVAPLVRPPVAPPTGDAGRGAVVPRVTPSRPGGAVPPPGATSGATPGRVSPTTAGSELQKRRPSAGPAAKGGGGFEGAVIVGGGGVSDVPAGGGGIDTQALNQTGTPKGVPQ